MFFSINQLFKKWTFEPRAPKCMMAPKTEKKSDIFQIVVGVFKFWILSEGSML